MKKTLLQHTKAFHPISVLKLNHKTNDFQAKLILNTTRKINISVWPQISTKSSKSVGSELVH